MGVRSRRCRHRGRLVAVPAALPSAVRAKRLTKAHRMASQNLQHLLSGAMSFHGDSEGDSECTPLVSSDAGGALVLPGDADGRHPGRSLLSDCARMRGCAQPPPTRRDRFAIVPADARRQRYRRVRFDRTRYRRGPTTPDVDRSQPRIGCDRFVPLPILGKASERASVTRIWTCGSRGGNVGPVRCPGQSSRSRWGVGPQLRQPRRNK
jgi:hypothetical protein